MQFFFGKYNGQPVENADAGYILWVQDMLTKHPKPSKKQKELLAYINENHSPMLEETKQLKEIQKAEKEQKYAEWKMLAMLSQHVGVIGEPIHFENIPVTQVKYHKDSDFWTFSFLKGNSIIHCYSSKLVKLNLKVGDTITMDAKVTKHKTFENWLNTTSVAYPKNIQVNAN
jgi:hypothetical protein